jgi:hypothetical protein
MRCGRFQSALAALCLISFIGSLHSRFRFRRCPGGVVVTPWLRPLPVPDFRQVLAVLVDVVLVLDKLVLELLSHIDALVAGLRQAVDGVYHKVKAIQIVQHGHVEGRCDGPLFLVAPDMDVVVVGAAVGQPVDQRRVGMEGEDDRLVLGEERIEIHVAQPMRVLGLRL